MHNEGILYKLKEEMGFYKLRNTFIHLIHFFLFNENMFNVKRILFRGLVYFFTERSFTVHYTKMPFVFPAFPSVMRRRNLGSLSKKKIVLAWVATQI